MKIKILGGYKVLLDGKVYFVDTNEFGTHIQVVIARSRNGKRISHFRAVKDNGPKYMEVLSYLGI